MGDRGNIIVKEGCSEVYLYTHWSGSDLPGIVSKSLRRGKDRWNDGPYLARILFCDMLNGDNGLTGFGISSVYGDGGTDITVDVDKQTVRLNADEPKPFAEFAAAVSA